MQPCLDLWGLRMNKLAILGASGHGKVIADAALCMGVNTVVFFDDKWPLLDGISEWNVIGNTALLLSNTIDSDGIIIAIGDNTIRNNKARVLSDRGYSLTKIIHPSAIISRFASIGEGSVIFAGAIVNPDCIIGKNCIINSGAIIEHDCVLGDGVHISPGARLAGNVRVGDLSWIGIGACVRQQINIGNSVIVGAGSVVINDVEDNSTVIGIPGRTV